jgi:hypothetical protein
MIIITALKCRNSNEDDRNYEQYKGRKSNESEIKPKLIWIFVLQCGNRRGPVHDFGTLQFTCTAFLPI